MPAAQPTPNRKGAAARAAGQRSQEAGARERRHGSGSGGSGSLRRSPLLPQLTRCPALKSSTGTRRPPPATRALHRAHAPACAAAPTPAPETCPAGRPAGNVMSSRAGRWVLGAACRCEPALSALKRAGCGQPHLSAGADRALKGRQPRVQLAIVLHCRGQREAGGVAQHFQGLRRRETSATSACVGQAAATAAVSGDSGWRRRESGDWRRAPWPRAIAARLPGQPRRSWGSGFRARGRGELRAGRSSAAASAAT